MWLYRLNEATNFKIETSEAVRHTVEIYAFTVTAFTYLYKHMTLTFDSMTLKT